VSVQPPAMSLLILLQLRVELQQAQVLRAVGHSCVRVTARRNAQNVLNNFIIFVLAYTPAAMLFYLQQ